MSKTGLGRPSSIRASLFVSSIAFLVPWLAASGQAWDVSNTGQPSIEAEFTVNEGTWMSLDVTPDGQSILFDMRCCS